MSGASLATGAQKVRDYGWTLAKYVAALKLDKEDLARLHELGEMGKYPVNDKGDENRIRDRGTMHLEGEDYDQRALAFAYLTAQFGPRALKHIVVSYRDGPVSLEMAERHRDTFLRVLGAENCAGFYGLHGDTARPHFHLALNAYDLTQKNLNKWGQEFEIEALHIASALCERDDMLLSEPNRRYVADETGVYHTLSGIKVADENGRILNASRMLRVPGLQHKIEDQLRTPDGLEAGNSVPAETSIKIFAKAARESARDWGGFHRGLARVGLRYEPYEAAGKIVGGYFVPVDAEEPNKVRVKASAIGAGYKKLVDRFNQTEYEEPPADVWFRPFQTLGFVGEPPANADSRNREREIQRAEDERLAMLTAEIAVRHGRDGLSARAIQKARAAKQRKKLGQSLDQDDDPLNDQSAKYRKYERDFIEGVKRTIKQERGATRGRKRAKPIDGLLWGVSSSVVDDQPAWLDKYNPMRLHGIREFYDGEVLAFTETRNFVALHSSSKQHRIDALLLAQKKFGTIRIEGSRKERKRLIKLAVELGIPLDRSHEGEVERIKRRTTSEQSRGRISEPGLKAQLEPYQDAKNSQSDSGVGDDPDKEAHALRKNRQRRLNDLRYLVQRDSRERRHRVERHFPAYHMSWLQEGNESAADVRGPNPPPNESIRARRKLEGIDRNRLMLASSQKCYEGYRFLDDKVLTTAFTAPKRWLMLPEIQKHLKALAAIQEHERHWIASAAQSARVTIEKDELLTIRKVDDWATEFYHRQRNDPHFQAKILLARLAPKRFALDLDVHPGIAAWRQAHREGDAEVASYIAYELDRMAVKHGEVSVPNGAEAKADKTLMTLRNGAADEFRKQIAGPLSRDEREALSKTRSVTATVFAQFPWASIRSPKRMKRYARKRSSRHIGAAVHDRNGR
ncbi:LPD7 domain-containing protein [Qipengyuania flava]|uniref:LPD7 domain-containing protein n=1 Tax=Qipengyuania flava TaxID=192812 RepID=UPI00273D985C|nr:LPD7 domain-containing protein [Qipengyuania flava]